MSEELQNGIPLPEQPEPTPDFLKDDGWFDVDITADLLDFEEPYRPPRYTLERNGVKFADVGDLHIITGKPGHGKTGLISQIMAAVLCGRFGKMSYCLSERPEPVLLYIDTEQGKDDTIAIKNRVCTLAGLPYDKPLSRFVILRLRDTEEASDRWKKILKAIYVIKPTDIFLDGMLDIVKDYNDQVECQPVVRKCMKVATEYDTSLWAVLHENPMVDKLVGTLGSIVQRKVSEIFAVRKIKQCDLKPNEQRPDMPDIYFQVKQLKARGKDVSDWLFRYETNAGGWGVPVEIEDGGATVANPEEVQVNAFVNEANDRFGRLTWTNGGLSRSDIDTGLYSQGVTSNRRRQDLINIALDRGILYKSGTAQRPKYHYNGLAKPLPNDEAETIDFKESEDKPPF